MSSEPAPESTLPYPPIHKDKKFVVLSDWLVASSSRMPSGQTSCGGRDGHQCRSIVTRVSCWKTLPERHLQGWDYHDARFERL